MAVETLHDLLVLELAGSPEEMGELHGVALRPQIQRVVHEYLRRSEEIFEVPYRILLDGATQCEPHIPLRYRREMRALAEAADVAYVDILALNCLVDIDAVYTQKLTHCCNFVVAPPATTDSLLLHGRNLDFPHGNVLPALSTIFVRRPDEPHLPTLSVAWAGYVGALTGCNAASLSLAVVGVPSSNPALDGTPLPFLMRDALETSADLSQCLARIHAGPRTCGYNLAACSGREQRAIGIECTRTLCEHRPMRRGSLVVDDVCLCGKTGRMRLTHSSGTFRHARMTQLIDQFRGGISTTIALDFLRDRYDMAHAIARGKGYNCICNEHTIQSVLFSPVEDIVYIAAGQVPAPLGIYTKLNLRDYWR